MILPTPAAADPPRIVTHAAFSHSEPSQLQFSCALILNGREETYAQQLADADPEKQLRAARTLWWGHSRRYAVAVLKFLAGPPPGGESYRAFQREVDAALQPAAILGELQTGDYRWGAWLAFLRPHPDLVSELLAGLENKPELLPETMLALGNSGDRRALPPLLQLLRSNDYRQAGDAAKALGYLDDPQAEPVLIEALAAGPSWRQVNACRALSKLGTRRAVPAMEKLANDERYTGALNIQGSAEDALRRIRERER